MGTFLLLLLAVAHLAMADVDVLSSEKKPEVIGKMLESK